MEDVLIGSARRQVDLYLRFQLDDAGGDLDQAQSQGVELHDTPGGALGHQPAQRPQQPISAGVQEEAELIGLGLGAGGAVGGKVVLPRLDVVLLPHVKTTGSKTLVRRVTIAWSARPISRRRAPGRPLNAASRHDRRAL
jgi:hypothetical protein